MYNVYQHWDPLKVCAVGTSYGPEHYSWIKNSRVRQLFEKIALETEEDYQAIIKKLQSFDVKIVRSELVVDPEEMVSTGFMPPPMNPRDHMIMIGKSFYTVLKDWKTFYREVKAESWPMVEHIDELEPWQHQECLDAGWSQLNLQNRPWQPIYDSVLTQKQSIKIVSDHPYINGAGVSRIGKDLYFALYDNGNHQEYLRKQFPEYRSHIVRTQGHGDGTYCPVCPGLIISLMDVPTYQDTFPDWEVVYLPDQSWEKVKAFLKLKQKNQGRWWIPGWEHDQDVIDLVETWLTHWTGYVEETVFDVNMLIIDPKNVIVFNENDQVFKALNRYGITPHVIPFRHRYFWDGGIHCVTLDLHREGVMQDFFPDRSV